MSVPSMVQQHRSAEPARARSQADSDREGGVQDLLPDCKVKRTYTCAECDHFTQNPRAYLHHLRDAHGEKVKIHECPSCLYASRHYQKLRRHKRMVHGGEKCEEEQQQQLEEQPAVVVFRCSVCDFSSRGQAQLTKHERDEHIKTRFFRCSKCNYVTHIKARYTKHVKYHSMPMIKCDMCDFRTPYKWNLDRHCKNHNGNGAFRCSACNFTADIKQSLTVHEMNHHVPPVGQAAGLGVGRRRNKVGASDATAAEEAGGHRTQVAVSEPEAATLQPPAEDSKKPKTKIQSPKKTNKPNHHIEVKNFGVSDFIDPDDIVSHANGKVYLKNKCKLCNFKTAWDSEMVKHERKAHNIDREEVKSVVKKPPRPIPNLIPIPSQAAAIKLSQQRQAFPVLKAAEIPEPSEPEISQKDMNDICAKSSNSVLKDFASLFGSEDVFNPTPKVPDLIPAAMYNNLSSPKSKFTDVVFKQKNASFFDSLREKLELGTGGSGNLTCNICGHESKCLTEQAKHQKTCGKETDRVPNVIPMHNISSTRCQACRQRCKSSTDLYNHLQACPEAIRARNLLPKEEVDSESEGELKIDMDGLPVPEEEETKPHPMENKVFVWNDILVPMDIEVDDSNYEYTEDKVDDNVSLDLSVRTQSPLDSESSYLGQELNTPNSLHHSPVPPSTDKVPTHGNDISVAQHKRVFKCPHCTFWASTASRFHVHIVGHLNKKPFECSLCSYRSNWRWDITKHIKLKSVRDPAHESAKVLMTDETGRRNYTKYNKYLTEIPVSSDQSMDTSGGCGTRPKHHDRNASPSTSKSDLPKLNRISAAGDLSQPQAKNPHLRPPPSLKVADKNLLAEMTDRKRSSSDGKRTLFKCKKCNFKDASRDVLLQHVKGHYQQHPQPHLHPQHLHPQQRHLVPVSSEGGPSTSAQDLRLRGTSPDRDDERHCRLKHNGDIRVVSNKNGHEKVEVEEITDEPDHIDITQEGTFKCNFCPFSNDNDSEFEHHLSGHVPPIDNAFKCYYCKFYVSQKEDLYNHLRLHGIPDPEISRMLEKGAPESDGKKFRCTICPYVTNSKSQYTYHKQFHKPRGGQYPCSHCSYNVSKRHLLHQHLKVHGINIASHKQNGESIFLDEITDEIEEVPPVPLTIDLQNSPDIPLVWVSKNGKFSKMFKCRYCPHVNLRKVNIQEHEKMHSIREKSQNSNRLNDTEHRCTECNYVCNNAGVLSSHSKVHQGMYGIVHRLVDPTKTDEEQIKELSRSTGITPTPDIDDVEVNDSSAMEIDEIDSSSGSGSLLYFCKECPARFLKENEFGIHKRFHGSRLFYKCDYCTYTSREKPHLTSHSKVHTNEYQERTKVLQTMYLASSNYPQPKTSIMKASDGQMVWMISENKSTHKEMSTLCSILSKPVKASLNVPLSGTDLFLQKSEAEQKQAAEMISEAALPQKFPDIDINELMRGNPDFIYQPYLKNGRLKEKRYKCHMCPTAFEKKEQYKVHLGLHGSKQRYKCDYCDYSVKYYANFVQHLKKHKMNAEAHAARRPSDEGDLEVDESAEVSTETTEDSSRPLKPSVADQQVAAILQHREAEQSTGLEDKKHYWCPNCPYTSARKDAVDNHQKRHVAISGVKSTYTCEHCDYSVPQSHFLKEHTKLHFMPNKLNQVEGFMICDNLKLTSNQVDGASKMEGDVENDQKLIFEESGSELFLPSLGTDSTERFNNNEGEKQFVNVQTGEIIKEVSSDIRLPEIKEECKMEVN